MFRNFSLVNISLQRKSGLTFITPCGIKKNMNRPKPITPGEILLEEFLKPMGISRSGLAKEIFIPARRISEIIAGKRSIAADTDLRLCRFFGLSNGYWLRAQIAHDTEVAEQTLGEMIKKIKPWSPPCGRQPMSLTNVIING